MISPQIKFKKKWLDNKGVSEIIGTILMLAITVVLFSSIMVFVTNMPTPTAEPTVDFLSHLTVSTDPLIPSSLTLTHNGGEPLNDYETTILLVIDGSPKSFFPTGIFSDAKWSIGRTWTFNAFHNYPNFGTNTSLEAMIIDTKSNSQVWNSRISAGAGNNAPVILQRWTDSDTSTLTADPIIEGDVGFSLFVRVTDADNNLLNVTVDASSIGSGSNKGNYSINGGVWEFKFTNSITQASLFDGRPLLIKARDRSVPAHWTNATFLLTVSASERGPTGAPGPAGPPGTGTPVTPGGLPSYLKYFDSDQGYVVLGPNTSVSPPILPNFTDARGLFKQGEWVFIRVASYKLQNIFAENSLVLVNRLSGVSVRPCGGLNTTPFYRVAEASGVNVYEAKFDSSQLLGGYDMEIDLRSTVTQGSTLISFGAITGLVVQPASGTQLTLPEIRTNKTMPLNRSDAEYMGSYNNPFDLSDASKCRIFVNLIFLNCGGGSTLTIGNVELNDLRNRQILYGVPPAFTGTNGTFGKKYSDLTGVSQKSYAFAIDLRMKNGYNFVPGLSSYTLLVSNASDGNEGIYSMSINVWIRSSAQSENFVVATSGYGFAPGSTNFLHYDFLFQTENNRFFTTRVIQGVDMSPGGKGEFNFYRAIYFDIDGDGDRDVISSGKYANVFTMGIYINRLNEFGLWEPRSVLPSSNNTNVTALAYGDVDADGDYDWAAATANHDITLYYNEFPVRSKALRTLSDYVYEMRLVDVTGDGKADLIVLAGADAVRTVNSVGRILMWDLYNGVANPILDVDASANIYDFDVANMGGDSGLDYAIVTSAASGNIKWWESQKTTANFFAASETNVTGTSSPGTRPTRASPADGVAETVTESATGNLEHMWTMASISGFKPILTITAKVAAGATEGFQFFYSKTSLLSGPWTFMFAVASSQTSYADYTFPLPLSTSGVIYVRVIDTNPADGTPDGVMVDMLRITTTSKVTFNAVAHELYTDTSQRVIGIGNFDNFGNLDVAVAKSGQFKVINGTSTLASLKLLNTTAIDIRPTGDTFSVTDVNGDGLDDIVSVLLYSYTISPKTYDVDAIVYEWLNVGLNRNRLLVDFYGIEIKNMIVSYGNESPGGINSIAVENPYG